jgi:hypothetical protein
MAEMARRLRAGTSANELMIRKKRTPTNNLFFKVQDILLGLLSLHLYILVVEGSLYLR